MNGFCLYNQPLFDKSPKVLAMPPDTDIIVRYVISRAQNPDLKLLGHTAHVARRVRGRPAKFCDRHLAFLTELRQLSFRSSP